MCHGVTANSIGKTCIVLFINVAVALPKECRGSKPCSWRVELVAAGGREGNVAVVLSQERVMQCNAQSIVWALLETS